MKTRTARLKRTRSTYEFLIRYPWGTSAINGYRRAAHHFGLHTREDPTADGSDAWRTLVHKSARKLREAAGVLNEAYSSQDDSIIDKAEMWLASESDVAFFAHDWKHWDQEQDEGALEHLRWKRTIVETSGSYRITLRIVGRRRRQRVRRRQRG